MRPQSPPTNKARSVCVDDIHHRTADQSRTAGIAAAKAMKHAERQRGDRSARDAAASCCHAHTPVSESKQETNWKSK